MHNVIESKIGLEGFFKIEAVQPDGSSRVLADWFPNLITNIGLDRWGVGGIVTACGVGTGTAQPLVTDTGLQSPLAFTASKDDPTPVSSGAGPYYVTQTRTFTFAQGAVVGNISEVSVGWATTNGSAWSHARIKDGGGVDTTITVTAIEQLSVTYSLRGTIPSTDVVSNLTIGGVSTAVTMRGSKVSSSWWVWNGANQTAFDRRFDIDGSSYTGAFDGAIGPITGSPSGTLEQINISANIATYVNGSYYTEKTWNFNISQGNFAGGLDSLWISNNTHTRWQIGFVPPIAKDATKTLAFTVRSSWARV